MRCVEAERGAALLKQRLPGCWRCNVPAIRTLQANMESQEHTALHRGATLSGTQEVFELLIKIHYNLPRSHRSKEQSGSIDNPHLHDKYTGNTVCQRSSRRPFLSRCAPPFMNRWTRSPH